MFGLYAFSGKANAFLGPLLLGWTTVLFDSQRMGMVVVVMLLLIGGSLMLRVPDNPEGSWRRGGSRLTGATSSMSYDARISGA